MKTSICFLAGAIVAFAFGFANPVTAQLVSDNSNQVNISSLVEARKLAAMSMTDTAQMPKPTFEIKTSNILASANPFGNSFGTTNDANRLALPDMTNADTYLRYMKEQEKRYRYRLDLINHDTIPDIFQIQLRTDIHRKLSMIRSAESLGMVSKINLTWQTDADGERILAFPLGTLSRSPRYGMLDSYRHGFARIKKDQVFGFLNVAGEEIIPCQYELAEPFNDGKALVKKVDWFFINAAGEESTTLDNVIDAKSLNWGYSLVKLQSPEKNDKEKVKYAIIDNSYDQTKKPLSALYDQITPFNKRDILLVRNGKKYGLVRVNGSVRLGVDFDAIETTNVPSLIKVTINQKVGLIDTLGNMKLRPTFDEISDFGTGGMAIVKEGGNWYLLRQQDLRMSQPYAKINDFDQSGLAIVQNSNKLYGLINKDLKTVKDATYTSIGAFNKYGLAPACKEGSQCGFINLEGREVIPMQFNIVSSFGKYGLVTVEENIKDCIPYGGSGSCKVQMVYDYRGNVVIPKAEGDGAIIKYAVTDTLIHDYIVVKTMVENNLDTKRTNYHLVEKDNMVRITPTHYESIRGYDVHFLFTVRKNGKWGLIDTTGREITKCIYKSLTNPGEGFYVAQGDNGKFGYVDKKGKQQIMFEYDQVMGFNDGVAIVSKGNNKYGIINRFNAKIVPCAFASIEYSDVDKLQVMSNTGDKFFVNTKGDCLENCTKFEEIRLKANQSGN
jgi:WG containing repeat